MMDLEVLVAEMRRLGVTRYKTADVEIELGKEPLETPEPTAMDPIKAEQLATKKAEIEAERRKRTLLAATSMRVRARST